MPNLTPILNDIIRRISRREIRANTRTVKKATSHYRHAIAALKKQVADLAKQMSALSRRQPGEPAAAPELLAKGRFRAVGVKAHRAKLGLSAKQYGKLVGVSELTIYHWESGKARPRNKQTAARWLAVRELGKREAMERLGLATPVAKMPPLKAAGRGPRVRGKFKLTAVESILAWLKGRKTLTTAQINAAWANEGRLGNADNALSMMTRTRLLKRTKLKGQRGSAYAAA